MKNIYPQKTGEPPLGRCTMFGLGIPLTNKVVSNDLCHAEPVEASQHNGVFPLELNTMPGWAGSSWYFFNRYMEDAMR